MTDNEIIKALECCSTDVRENACPKCVFYKKHRCSVSMLNAASDLISRQREELNKYPIKTIVSNNCEIHSKTSKDYDNLMADIKSEAIKEFAEQLKKRFYLLGGICVVNTLQIDNLAKQMTEVEELCNDFMVIPKNVPTADVAEVQHGKWKNKLIATNDVAEMKSVCSLCNKPNKQYQPPYCPHCGAKMDKERQ